MKRRSLVLATGPLDDRFTLDNGLTRIDRSESTYRARAPPDDLQQLTINGSQVVRFKRGLANSATRFSPRPVRMAPLLPDNRTEHKNAKPDDIR
ncbi:hypothetical protein [Paraburkholderia sp. CI3]|uniref:hypothetical protein n=1 Tax=Paraburkholderia sp. CI3 TaxID=2991060 RepID=UPI003D1A9F9A